MSAGTSPVKPDALSVPDADDRERALSADKSRLLTEQLLARRQARTLAPRRPDVITARDHAGTTLLSVQQERLYVVDRIAENVLAYNQAQAFRFRGPLDRRALDRAVAAVQERHQILRTRIELVDGQIVVSHGEARTVDLLDAPAPDAAEDRLVVDRLVVDRLVVDEVRRPLDLATDGPFRAALIPLGEQDHVLVLSLHHVVSDDVSKRVLFADLSHAYNAAVAGHPLDLPPLELQFADYAAWQRDPTTGWALEADAATTWWTGYLAGAPPQTGLPLDRPRRPVGSNRGAKYRSRLPRGVADALAEASRELGATRFMVLLAAFAYVVEIYSAEGDVVIGTPLSGRGRPELRNMIGLFLNTLPVRVNTSGDIDFAALVGRVRESVAGVLGHQDVPFDLVLDAVRPARDPSHAPVFQTMFTLRSEAAAAPEFTGVQAEAVGFDAGWTKFDLGVTCIDAGPEIDVLWQYNTDLFDRSTVERVADRFGDLLEQALKAPRESLRALAAAQGGEYERVVREWNDTAADAGDWVSVPELFERVAAAKPDAVAVLDEQATLTFAELDRLSDQVAGAVAARGLGRGDIVAVAARRSRFSVAALLGVLKAGAAYLPIDPSYPADRIVFLLNDSDTQLILTDRASVAAIPLGVPRIVLDTELPQHSADHPASRKADRPGPDDLAYVIYTSGSTGTPKGVLCEHGGLANRLHWMSRELELTSADVFLQKTPATFDVSMWELLLPGILGARLVMARPGAQGDPDYLRAVIDEQAVTVAHFVPSMLQAFLAASPAGACPSLRVVVASGEALPDEVAARSASLLPHAALWNLYGPTEASIDVTAERFAPRDGRPLTIGRPITNMRTYVLDPELRPMPVGAPGELFLAGVGVARGYLNRPELDAERFLTDPFAGGRMYRTGDRARWRADGRIDYLGRADGQVKLRGFRIELAGIESTIRTLPGVRAAVCEVRTSAAGDQSLLAFVVPEDASTGIDGGQLRAQLARLLPAFEVPSIIGVIDSVPVSPNGKIDRSGLPGLAVTGAGEHVAPRDAIEIQVERIWR